MVARSGAALVAADASQEGAGILFGHGARHLAGAGLSQAEVEAAIVEDIAQLAPRAERFTRTVMVDGQAVKYKAFRLPDGRINVGTYYTPK